MEKRILTMAFVLAFITGISFAGGPGTKDEPASNKVVYLTDKSFKELVFDYEKNKEWKYEGKKPAIIDFYADWCGPCRQLSPLVEDLAKEYEGKIIVYKVDTEKEKTLARNLGITGLPTLLFIPVTGEPQVQMGVVPKSTLTRAVEEILLNKQ